MFRYGPASRSRILTLHPKLRKFLLAAILVSPVDFGIASGARDKDEQTVLFVGPPKLSNARFGESPHNTVDQDGEPESWAFDFYLWEGHEIWGGPKVERHAVWLQGFAASMGVTLILGRDFKSIDDPGHCEMKGWEAHAPKEA